jgi:hypothetical protein
MMGRVLANWRPHCWPQGGRLVGVEALLVTYDGDYKCQGSVTLASLLDAR